MKTDRPITKKEQYLAKAAGAISGDTPPAVTKEEQYLKKIADSITDLTENPLPKVSSEDEGKVPIVGSDGKWEIGEGGGGGGGFLVVKATGTGVYDSDNDAYIIPADASVEDLMSAYENLTPIMIKFPDFNAEEPYYSYEEEWWVSICSPTELGTDAAKHETNGPIDFMLDVIPTGAVFLGTPGK